MSWCTELVCEGHTHNQTVSYIALSVKALLELKESLSFSSEVLAEWIE